MRGTKPKCVCGVCRLCKARTRHQRWKRDNPERVKANHDRWQKSNRARAAWQNSQRHARLRGYEPIRMSLGEFLVWFSEAEKKADGLCDWCKQPFNGKNAHVEHNHRTGDVRGLVCWSCNTIEGAARTPQQLRYIATLLENK